jgi:hypothetical protein
MTRRLVTVALLLLLASLGPSPLTGQAKKKPPRKEPPLPEGLKEALEKAETVVLYSLEPRDVDGKVFFHDYRALGRVDFKEKEDSAEAVKAVSEGLRGGQGAKCFDPRHGLRLVRKGKTVDLVICFRCNSVRVYGLPGNDKYAKAAIAKTAQETLDKILRDGGVPLAKPPKP